MPATLEDLIDAAMAKQPTTFSDAYADILGAKAAEKVADMKIQMAQNMYGGEDESPEDVEYSDDDEGDVDSDEEEFEFDDEDLEAELEGLDTDEDS